MEVERPRRGYVPGAFAGETRGIVPILATSFAGVFSSGIGGAAV